MDAEVTWLACWPTLLVLDFDAAGQVFDGVGGMAEGARPVEVVQAASVVADPQVGPVADDDVRLFERFGGERAPD